MAKYRCIITSNCIDGDKYNPDCSHYKYKHGENNWGHYENFLKRKIKHCVHMIVWMRSVPHRLLSVFEH